MIVLEAGHVYDLKTLDGEQPPVILTFVNREDGKEHSGTQCQEVIRALIDRVHYLEEKVHWSGNEEIVQHLRMALALFEARALIRKVERKKIEKPEVLPTGNDGHLMIAGTPTCR